MYISFDRIFQTNLLTTKQPLSYILPAKDLGILIFGIGKAAIKFVQSNILTLFVRATSGDICSETSSNSFFACDYYWS